MNKVFYEYEYTFGSTTASKYRLVVERETERMLYGKRYVWDVAIANFAIKKDSLNLNQIKDEITPYSGSMYKVIVEEENHEEVAERIIKNYLQNIVDKIRLDGRVED
jgi:hypothetical protein